METEIQAIERITSFNKSQMQIATVKFARNSRALILRSDYCQSTCGLCVMSPSVVGVSSLVAFFRTFLAVSSSVNATLPRPGQPS